VLASTSVDTASPFKVNEIIKRLLLSEIKRQPAHQQ
jgi:hypothetical protein